MCTGGGRKPTSCANFLRTPLMRAEQVALARSCRPARSGGSRPPGRACRPACRSSQLASALASGGGGAGLRRVLGARAGACAAARRRSRGRARDAAGRRGAACPGSRPSSADDAGGDAERARRAEHLAADLACRRPAPCRRARPPSPRRPRSAAPGSARPARRRPPAGCSCRPPAPADRPCCATPMTKPPMMLMNRIRMPAIASPRTNFEAPSIEPKNSASSPTSARRRLASFSSIRPAFRSASIAICLPGIASRVKRAPTSAMRSAPLVTTMKLMTTRIANTIRPTAKLPPIRKWPNDSITVPAAPGAGVALEQHHAGRGDVERQPQQRGQQQHRREGGEVERPHHVGRDHHHHQRHRDVEGEQQVERERRQRQHHHRQDHHDDERRHQRLADRLGVRRRGSAWSRCIRAFMSTFGSVGAAATARRAGRARPARRARAAAPRHRRAGRAVAARSW